jgi:nucleotide-binding universal stress UspA family protein
MRIIVGVDGSEHAMHALERTIERARAAGDELTVAAYASDEGALERVVTETREFLETVGFDGELERITGEPGSRIVERAESGEYDRIVLPGGSRSPLGKIQIDSTIEFVLLNTNTTVTLVR